MYALASSGVGWAPALCRYSICVLRAALAACQGVGCTPWRRLASAGHRRSAGSSCVAGVALDVVKSRSAGSIMKNK